MNTTTEHKKRKCTPVKPDGKSISISNYKKFKDCIDFNFNRLGHPCQPLTVAQLNSTKNTISASTVVFIDEELGIKQQDLSVLAYLSYDNSKVPFLNIYVCYDKVPLKGILFRPYRLDFDITIDNMLYTPNAFLQKEGINLPAPTIEDIPFITSFLWDEDPEGSRGTETTVKQPN